MRNPIEFLVQQQTNTPNREQLRKHPYGRRILRSWYSTRLTVGILGIAMPFVLIIGDLFVLEGSAWTRGSLSAYYHSGCATCSSASCCIVGVFLISYRMSDWRHPDNWLSTAAGIAALLVAFFPTTTGDGEIPTLAGRGARRTARRADHLVAAAVFLLALAGVSYLFSRRDSANHLPATPPYTASVHRDLCSRLRRFRRTRDRRRRQDGQLRGAADRRGRLDVGVRRLLVGQGAELRLAWLRTRATSAADAYLRTATASKPVVT